MNIHQLVLLGLPGSGKTRLAEAFLSELPHLQVLEGKEELDRSRCCVATVLPIDQALPNHSWALSYLADAIESSDVIILNFVEKADLTQQSAWQKWLKSVFQSKKLPGLASVRCFNQQVSTLWLSEKSQHAFPEQPLPRLEDYAKFRSLEIPVEKLNLNHFLMAMDAFYQQFPYVLWRLKGEVETVDYMHPVSIEGTHEKVVFYPCVNFENKLTFQGVGLPEAYLNELLSACQLS